MEISSLSYCSVIIILYLTEEIYIIQNMILSIIVFHYLLHCQLFVKLYFIERYNLKYIESQLQFFRIINVFSAVKLVLLF